MIQTKSKFNLPSRIQQYQHFCAKLSVGNPIGGLTAPIAGLVSTLLQLPVNILGGLLSAIGGIGNSLGGGGGGLGGGAGGLGGLLSLPVSALSSLTGTLGQLPLVGGRKYD